MQGQRVNDRGEHAHLVAFHAVEAFLCAREAAENVASADDDADLDACGRSRPDLFGVGLEYFGESPYFCEPCSDSPLSFSSIRLYFMVRGDLSYCEDRKIFEKIRKK